MDILLAIGSIDPSQYQPVLDKMREHGMEPQLVHINTSFCSEYDFRKAAGEHMPPGLGIDLVDAYVDGWVEQRKSAIITTAFQGLDPMDVRGVIRLATDGSCPSAVYMDWLMERLPATHAEHLIFVGENQQTWIEGDYGRLEPLVYS